MWLLRNGKQRSAVPPGGTCSPRVVQNWQLPGNVQCVVLLVVEDDHKDILVRWGSVVNVLLLTNDLGLRVPTCTYCGAWGSTAPPAHSGGPHFVCDWNAAWITYFVTFLFWSPFVRLLFSSCKIHSVSTLKTTSWNWLEAVHASPRGIHMTSCNEDSMKISCLWRAMSFWHSYEGSPTSTKTLVWVTIRSTSPKRSLLFYSWHNNSTMAATTAANK